MNRIEHAGRIRPLHSPFSIGAAPDCDLQIEGQELQPHHGLLLESRDGWYWVDREGQGQSWCNGQAVKGIAPVSDGDLLTLGQAPLSFHGEGARPRGHRALEALEGANRVLHALRSLRAGDEESLRSLLGSLARLVGSAEARLHMVAPFPSGWEGTITWPEGLSDASGTELAEGLWAELETPCLLEPPGSPSGEASWHGIAPFFLGEHRVWLHLPFPGRPPALALQLITLAAVGLRARLSNPRQPKDRPSELDGTATWKR